MADPIIYKPFVGDYANAGTDIYAQGTLPTGVFTIMACAMPGQVTPLTAARSPVLQEMAQMSVGGVESDVQSLSLTAGAAPVQIDIPQDKTPFVTSCKVSFSPSQDLHGYDSPWPAGGGVNKCGFPAVDFTLKGVRYYTVNGTLYVDGTSLSETSANSEEFNALSITLPAGTYYFDRHSFGTPAYLKDSSNNSVAVNKGSFTLIEETTLHVGLYVYQRVYSNNEVTLSIVDGSTAPASYAPYSNICPISGWQGAEVYIEPTYDPTATPKASVTFGQTILGGTAEIVAGTGSDEWAVFDGGDYNWTKIENSNFRNFSCSPHIESYGNSDTKINAKSDAFKGVTYNGATSQDDNYVWIRNTDEVCVKCTAIAGLTEAEFKTLVTGVKFYVRRATPTPYTFPPASDELLMQKGENFAWAEMIPE